MDKPTHNQHMPFEFPNHNTKPEYQDQQPVNNQQWYYPRAGQLDSYSVEGFDPCDVSLDSNLSASSVTSSMGEDQWARSMSHQHSTPLVQDCHVDLPISTRTSLSIAPNGQPIDHFSMSMSPDQDRPNSTNGRRRAQNRAAQRAFRERRQQHVKDLEQQLQELTERYERLEQKHDDLNISYEKLKRAVGFVTQEELSSKVESLRQVLDVLETSMQRAPSPTPSGER